ncbi:AAA family ATPase [Bacteroides sedimenti]|uniref:Chromosome segregation protein SMC n=1 Tax=Bacteroides sedimenti TaxID=2136147 RepID=A0ABN6Z1B4_9BACE
MITKLFIDGFKSLVDFEVSFTKGINVLIGPNGVGKTNVCQAMSILASMPNNELKDVLNQFGGANSVFNKGKLKNGKIFIIKAEGETLFKVNKKDETEEFRIKYIYEINIKLQRNGRLLVNEFMLIKRKNDNSEYISILDVSQKKGILRYEILDRSFLGDFKLPQKKLLLELDAEDNLWCIMPKISFVCHLVGRDLFRIKSINIDPNIARQACDIVDPNKMLGNGKFLSNALYSISKKSSKLDEINSIMEQSLPCCVKIKSEVSQLSLKRYFVLVDNEKNTFSSNSLSDGTIKLLGLLVGVINQDEYTMIIEEPENYLHPKIHRLLIEYLRETFENGACILTSHSETILNLMNPEELIICNLEDNLTKCKRIDDIESIKKAISESGFGCGYHYVTGNLSGL